MLKRKNEDELYQKELILKEVDELFGDHNLVKSRGQFAIQRWDGRKLKMKSGKTVWGRKGAASNALNYHIGRIPEELKNRFKNTVEYKDYLIKEGYVSIVEIQ